MLTLALRRSARASAAVAFFIFSWAPAGAQEVPPPKDSLASLPPVTITATRQNESLVMAPVAVTVLGKRDIENRSGYSLDGRVDAWLFPFLNVYGVAGYTNLNFAALDAGSASSAGSENKEGG